MRRAAFMNAGPIAEVACAARHRDLAQCGIEP
jgi:hypothetical protein